MAETLTPDLCIIGAGAGGLHLAEIARAHGAEVVLVERRGMDGDGLDTACVPSKALVESGRVAQALREAARFGIANDEPRPNFRAVAEHVAAVAAGLAPRDSAARFAALGVTVIAAEARFVDRRTVMAGDTPVRARRFVIATGSRPAVPEIPGLAEVPYFTTETIFANTRKLTHLLVIGAGPAGLELAQAYRRLGAQVTVVEAGTALGAADPELASVVLRRLRAEGVDIREATGVVEIVARSQGIGVRVAGPDGAGAALDVSHILLAAGREAEIATLDIAKARIRPDPVFRGRLFVRRNLRTSNRRVYAIGDAAGGVHSVHAARYQAELVLRSALFGLPVRYDAGLVPRLAFTDPEIAEVGLTEPQARARHRDAYRVTRWSFAANDRALTRHEGEGVARLITDRKGRILGAGLVGPEAGELIAVFALALAHGMTARDLTRFVAPYPTLAEIAARLGAEHERERSASPWLRRFAALVRRLP